MESTNHWELNAGVKRLDLGGKPVHAPTKNCVVKVRRTRTVIDFSPDEIKQIHALLDLGMTIKAICIKLDISLNAVSKYRKTWDGSNIKIAIQARRGLVLKNALAQKSRDENILALLNKGLRNVDIMKKLNVTIGVVRSVKVNWRP